MINPIPEIAKFLSDSKCDEYLSWDGDKGSRLFIDISNITDDMAKSLLKFNGLIIFAPSFESKPLDKISDSAALILSNHSYCVVLDELKELNDSPGHVAIAEHMRRFQKDITLKIQYIHPKAASRLISKNLPSGALAVRLGEAASLSLDLNDLTKDLAEVLSQHRGYLSLDGVTELSNDAAIALGNHQGYLSLDGVTELSNDAAIALGNHQGELSLCALSEISDLAADVLSKRQHIIDKNGVKKIHSTLQLNGLTSLSNSAAEALGKYRGSVYLWGVKELSDVAAKGLSQHRDYLNLTGLEKLSDAAREIFHKNNHSQMHVQVNGESVA